MNERASGFVFDGLERLLRGPEFRQKRAAIEEAAVREDYGPELAAASERGQPVRVSEI